MLCLNNRRVSNALVQFFIIIYTPNKLSFHSLTGTPDGACFVFLFSNLDGAVLWSLSSLHSFMSN